ncbi:MAG: nucleotidyl transferase AbiEii/AbiGii toxin family protein [Mangrovibacterium sp.]
MINEWKDDVKQFIAVACKHEVRMLMVGGGAVNFHGYQRHSSDVDFWIDTNAENLARLLHVFHEMGYDIDDFPEAVKQQEQNISLKFSPEDLDVELITRFSVNKSFNQAYAESKLVEIAGVELLKWHVLSLEDLITSKIEAGRMKDLLDVSELNKINKIEPSK